VSEIPVIDSSKCSGCGLCVTVCSFDMLAVVDNVVIIVSKVEECDWCTLCEAVCPTGAISCPFEIFIDEP